MRRRPTDTLSVLCLCDSNAVRSQMAEALLRHHGGEALTVSSAGLQPVPIDPLTFQVLDEIGIPTQGLQAKSAKLYLCTATFDATIIVAEERERDAPILFPGTLNLLRWPCIRPPPVEVPAAQRLADFRAIRDVIALQAREWLASVTADMVH